MALTLLAAVTGCASSPPTGEGLVSGGIIPCQGIPVAGAPHYAAGTVTVLSGRIRWRALPNGDSDVVFPTAVAIRASVGVEGMYQFALRPGHYIVRAAFPPPANVRPFTEVDVHAGDKLRADIPNMCK